MAITLPAPQVLLLVDLSSASGGTVQNPRPQMAGYLLDVPAGETAMQVAAAFTDAQKYPVGTTAYLLDLSAAPLAIQQYTLTAQWVAA
jgi:hypothetical protein